MAQGIPLPVVQTGLSQSINQAVKQVGTINIPATIDPSAFKSLAQPLGRVSGLATEFEKSIAASNARVLAFGASVGIINGVQGAFADLLKTGIEVQKTLADIAAISGKGGADLSKFGDALFDVAKTTGQSFKTASQAALEFSRQGLGAEETLKRTTDALTLTRFTTLNAAEAVDVLTAAANSFSATGITTSQIINKLVAVDTKFAVSAEDLANGLSRAGSIAQEVGVNFDELNAAVTVAQERTARGGAVIGNALKTIFTRLRSDETVQALRDIGVESLNAQGQLKGAIPLLQEVANKIQGLSGGERIQILEAVASKYNINILSALLDDLNNANSKFTQAVAVSAGANNQAYERQIELNKTLAAELNKASVSATQLFNKLSEIGVTESLSTLLKFVNGLVDSFNKLLDSEGIGGNIARGLVKGISDVFFTVGLPIIAAIFVKLTRDIAKFGVESLKTILQINQESRERVALEQAVVNTLIRDQEIMATILSLSSNRAKQEEYLLGVYNRQLAALKQVQDIATTVTPALMAGGLTATSGQIKKRAAGGYLPAQETADVRRGVGGANASSKVVSIPNFAFGGGKRGTMIANTSEYVVPNFANGGSAIFNQDMVKAYGLPAGAKKISAAGGYIPNFADLNQKTFIEYAGLFAQEKIANPNPQVYINEKGKATNNPQEAVKSIGFRSFGVPSKGDLNTPTVDEIRKNVIDTSGALASDAALNFALAFDPDLAFDKKRVQEKAFQANQNKGAIEGFTGSIFEAAIASVLDDPHFKESQERSTISRFDFTNSSSLERVFGIPKSVKFLEAKNQENSRNINKIAEKINKVVYGGEEAVSTGKIKLQSPTVGERGKNARAFTDKDGITWIETANNEFKIASSDTNLNRYDTKYKKPSNPAKAIWGGRPGYIPNFAAGSPLGDAINREMAAGLNPSQIRVTTDGRLKNSQNPNGLAVINTRDEPNGKIPNFASRGRPDSPSDIRRKQARQEEQDFELATKAAGGSLTVSFEKIAESAKKAAKSIEDNSKSTENSKIGLDKLFYIMSGVSIASSTLESSFGKLNNGISDSIVALSKMAAGASQGALIGGTIQDLTKGFVGKGGVLGKILGTVSQRAPQAAIALGVGQAAVSTFEETSLSRIADQGSTEAGVASVKDIIDSGDIKKLSETRKKLLQEAKNLKYDVGRFSAGLFADQDQNQQINKITAALDAINKKISEGQKTKAKELDQEKKNTDEIRERTILASKLNEIALTFNDAENKSLIERTIQRDKFLKIQETLNASERFFGELILKESELQANIQTIRRKGLDDLIKELSQKGALATADAEQLDILLKRAAQSKDLLSIEKEINALSIKASAGYQSAVQNAKTRNQIEQNGVQTQNEANKINESTRFFKEQQKRDSEILYSLTLKEIAAEKDRVNLIRQSAAEMENLKAQAKVSNIETEIAMGGKTPTRKQKAVLAGYQAEQFATSEISKFEEDKFQKQSAIIEDYRSKVLLAAEAFVFLSDEEKRQFLTSINLAKNINEITDAYNAQTTAKAGSAEQLSLVVKANKLQSDAEAEADRRIQIRTQSESLLNEAMRNRIAIQEKLADQAKKEANNPFREGMKSAFDEIEGEIDIFENKLGKNTTIAFRDGLRDAMSVAISQTDDLNTALQNVAMNFLKTMQSAFINQAANSAMMGLKGAFPSVFNFAKGGLVNGGSGYRDDVPAMLTGGEFVMRKSAVQKYGAANLEKMNDGGIFLPGVRGGGAISGYDALKAFAMQTTTSGATDVLKGGGSSAYINLEDQSSKLSRYALLNEDTINQEIRSAQEQGLNIISEREKYRTQQRKAMQQQIVSTIGSAALSAGIGKLANAASIKSKVVPNSTGMYNILGHTLGSPTMTSYIVNGAYGGLIRRYASGGPTDDVPALLMSGEYVMNRQSTSKYGRRLLDSMNQGRAPRFADGGAVGETTASSTTESNAKMMGDVNISINVTGQNSQTETQGNANQGGVDYKKMSERIKAVVIETINEEKRLGGSLRTR